MYTTLKQSKSKVEQGGQVFISLKIAQMTKAELEEVYGMKTALQPWSVHPQYGQLYILKEDTVR